jgi:hypothetical protein
MRMEYYMDDIVIHSKIIDEHLNHIGVTLEKLRAHNMKINPEICTWITNTLRIFGYVLTDNGIKTDETKVKVISERKETRTIKELQCFLCMVNYFRKFIDEFPEKAALFAWCNSCVRSLEPI